MMEHFATAPMRDADRRRRPGWVVAHAVCWALLIFGFGELTRSLSFAGVAPGLASSPARSVALIVASCLFVVGLGVIDGLLFRRGRLLWVWAGALLAEAVLSSATTLYRVVNAESLQGQGHAQIAASVVPGLLFAAAFTLVLLGGSAAAGVAVGSLVGRRRVGPAKPVLPDGGW